MRHVAETEDREATSAVPHSDSHRQRSRDVFLLSSISSPFHAISSTDTCMAALFHLVLHFG